MKFFYLTSEKSKFLHFWAKRVKCDRTNVVTRTNISCIAKKVVQMAHFFVDVANSDILIPSTEWIIFFLNR